MLAYVLPALGAFLLFGLFGNATRGYIDTASLFVWWGANWFDGASESGHGPLILIAAAWLAWRNWRNSTMDALPRPVLGAWIMCAAIALHFAGYLVQQTRVSAAALLIFAWGYSWMNGGPRAAGALLFPLAFMLFSLPLGFLMDHVGFPMRLAVSSLSVDLTQLIGVEVLRDGTRLSSPDGRFDYDVAPACSGVRSLLALTAICVLLGYLSFRSPWKRVLLGLLALPLAFAGNVVRIFSIVMAGAWFGQNAGAWVHAVSGFMVFAVVLGGALLAAEFLRRRGTEPAAPAPDHDRPGNRGPLPNLAAAAGFVLLCCALAATLAERLDGSSRVGRPGIRVDASGQPAPLPADLGFEWVGVPVGFTEEERAMLPRDTGLERRLYQGLGGTQVLVSLVLSGRDRSSIHRPELCLAGQGWETTSSRQLRLELSPQQHLPVTVLTIAKSMPDGQPFRALFAYWFVSGDEVLATHFERMRHDVAARVAGNSPRWAYVIAQTPAMDGDAAALERLREVVARALPQFQQTPLPTAP